MGASNFAYAEAVWTQTLPDFIGAHVSAFRATGGMPHLIVLSDLADPPSMPRAVQPCLRVLPMARRFFLDMRGSPRAVLITARV
jgi:hypothetical protein